jgi:FlaG protein
MSHVEDFMEIKGFSGSRQAITASHPVKKGHSEIGRGSIPHGYFNSQDTSELRIHYDDQLGRTIVRIVDRESQEVVNQIPSEEMVAFLRKFRRLTGVLVDRIV